eukprot:2933808-Prymnesium_polylepis.1
MSTSARRGPDHWSVATGHVESSSFGLSPRGRTCPVGLNCACAVRARATSGGEPLLVDHRRALRDREPHWLVARRRIVDGALSRERRALLDASDEVGRLFAVRLLLCARQYPVIGRRTREVDVLTLRALPAEADVRLRAKAVAVAAAVATSPSGARIRAALGEAPALDAVHGV